MTAYFRGEEGFLKIPEKWEDFPLLCKGRSEDGPVDYDLLRVTDTPIDYGFDFDKPDREISIADLQSVAEAHGGKLLSENFETGDVYAPVRWQTQDGEEFSARPYTVLRCGHWDNPSYHAYAWEFDRLSKKDRIFASIWMDAHAPEENYRYWYDENFDARMEP